mmetsp:Transcript_168144/g.535061  ORF Transcript_168144/g.535061 Transcript_168144/m.535061 type:complete len:219 (+) Transcript_168144:302-958(+)
MLHGDWCCESGLRLCILHSSSGDVDCVRLLPPPAAGSARRRFEEYGLGALDVCLEPGIVCGCGVAFMQLPPPSVVLWDLASGLVLAEYDPQPSNPCGRPRALGGALSADLCHLEHVEFFAGGRWRTGQISAALGMEDQLHDDVCQIVCADGVVVIVSRSSVRRAFHVEAHDVSRALHAEADDASFETQIAISPERVVLVGQFHKHRPDGLLHVIEFGR